MTNKWMKQLSKMEGAVDKEYDWFASQNVLRSPSPSLNWVFGKGCGLPYGYGLLLWGPPKAGKSIISNILAGAVHADTTDGIVIKFNTEMREGGQMEDYWHIDHERYIGYDVNEPEFIFDRIKNEILPMVQDGMPLKMIIIDSLQGVQGVKEGNRASITNHLMGDHAKTIQDGLKAILPTIRRHKIALVCTEHIRGNLDAGQYGPKEKMAGGWGEKHFFEYYLQITRDGSAESKIYTDIKDFKDKKELAGHKIWLKMSDSSVGVAGRTGQITFSYDQGLINTHEEIATLAKNLNLVERPNNRTYIIGDQKYTSKAQFDDALRNDEELAQKLLKEIYERDTA